MKRLLLILLCVPLIGLSQSITYKKNKDFLFNACVEGFANPANPGTNHFKDNNSNEFCICFAETILEEFSSEEYKDLATSAKNSSEKITEQAYFLFQNPKIQSLMEKCFFNMEFKNESYIELTPEKLSIFIAQCKDEFTTGMSSVDIKELNNVFNLDGYCECFMRRMISAFTVSEIADFNSNNPDGHNLNKLTQMAEECTEIFVK